MSEERKQSLTFRIEDGQVLVTIVDEYQSTSIALDPAAALVAGERLTVLGKELLVDVDHVEGTKPSSQPTSATGRDETPRPAPRPTELSELRKPLAALPHSRGVFVPHSYSHLAENGSEIEWRVTHRARELGEELDISSEEMIAAASDPERIDDVGGDGAVHAHIRGHVSVLVPAKDPDAIIGVKRLHAPRNDPSAHTRPTGGGPGRHIPGSQRELLKSLEDHGFLVEVTGRKHPKITHPEHPGIVMSVATSPSDRRSVLNAVADIKRRFGVDVTAA